MTTTTTPHITLRISRRFEVPSDRVLDAWLDPAKIRHWMRGADEVVGVDVDPRLGGAFSFVVRRQGEDIEHVGEYLELARPKRLAFTWGVPRYSKEASIVRIECEPAQRGTLLTLTLERVPEEYKTRTEAGWTKILDAMAASLDII